MVDTTIAPPPPAPIIHAIVDSDARRAASTVSSLKKAWERMHNAAVPSRKRKLSGDEDCDSSSESEKKRHAPVFVTFRDVNDVVAVSRGNNKFSSILVATGSKDSGKLACLNEFQGQSVLIRVLVDAPTAAATSESSGTTSTAENNGVVSSEDASWKTIHHPLTPPVASAALQTMSPCFESPEAAAVGSMDISPLQEKTFDRVLQVDNDLTKISAPLCTPQQPVTGAKRMAKAMTRVRKSLREVAAVHATPLDRPLSQVSSSENSSGACLTDTSTSTSTETSVVEVSKEESKSPKFAIAANVEKPRAAPVPAPRPASSSSGKAKSSGSAGASGGGGKLWKDMLRPGHIAFRLEPGGRLVIVGMDEVASLNFEWDNSKGYVDANCIFDVRPSPRSSALANAVARTMRLGVRRVVCLNLYTAETRVPLACEFDILVMPGRKPADAQPASGTIITSNTTSDNTTPEAPITAVAAVRSISAVSCAKVLGLDLDELAKGVLDMNQLEAKITQMLL
jgi:hypothetical protein